MRVRVRIYRRQGCKVAANDRNALRCHLGKVFRFGWGVTALAGLVAWFDFWVESDAHPDFDVFPVESFLTREGTAVAKLPANAVAAEAHALFVFQA